VIAGVTAHVSTSLSSRSFATTSPAATPAPFHSPTTLYSANRHYTAPSDIRFVATQQQRSLHIAITDHAYIVQRSQIAKPHARHINVVLNRAHRINVALTARAALTARVALTSPNQARRINIALNARVVLTLY
jgi:hypothetical protein